MKSRQKFPTHQCLSTQFFFMIIHADTLWYLLREVVNLMTKTVTSKKKKVSKYCLFVATLNINDKVLFVFFFLSSFILDPWKILRYKKTQQQQQHNKPRNQNRFRVDVREEKFTFFSSLYLKNKLYFFGSFEYH